METILQESVIRNQLFIDEGDPYNEILSNKSINEIRSLNFFRRFPQKQFKVKMRVLKL